MAVLALGGSVICLAIAALVEAPLSYVLVGAVLASVPWMIYTAATSMPAASQLRVGLIAEEWTARALRPMRKAGWNVVHHVMLEKCDIDHAIVGPGGRFAIETKFRSAWGRSGEWHEEIAHRAVRAAWSLQTRTFLKRDQVQSIVAVWGPDARDEFPAPREIHGAIFCHGADLGDVLTGMPVCLGREAVADAFQQLSSYVEKRDRGEVASEGAFVRLGSQVFNEMIAICAAATAALLLVLAPIRLHPVMIWSLGTSLVLGLVAWRLRRSHEASAFVQRVTTAVLTVSASVGSLLMVVALVSAIG